MCPRDSDTSPVDIGAAARVGCGAMRYVAVFLLITCSSCAPSLILTPPSGQSDAGEDAAEVAVPDAAADAGTDAPADLSEAEVAVPDAAAVDASLPDALSMRVSAAAFAGFVVTSSRCSVTGEGTAAGMAAAFRVDISPPSPRTGATWVAGTVFPGAVGSVSIPEERVTAGVVTTFGRPYASAASRRVDFEVRATFRTLGPVTVTVTGCPVGL